MPAPPSKDSPRNPWPLRFAIGFGLFAALMAIASWSLLSRWSTLATVTPAQAASAIALARAGAGAEVADTVPYLEITSAGAVVVHREQEQAQPTPLSTLHLLCWEPAKNQLAQIDFPFWFVRLKLSKVFGLGTMVSGLIGDWEHLDLGVAEDDLERRGPGLVLDHTRGDQARVLIWTE